MVTTSVADYGAVPDGKFDSTAAFQACIAEANAQNTPVAQEVLVPPGSYVLSSPLVLDGMRGIRVRCPGVGSTGGALAGAQLLFTMASGTAAISARNSTGITLDGLQILNQNPGFTGNLVDPRGGNGGADTVFFEMRNCYVGGAGGVNSAVGLALDKVITSRVQRTNFVACTNGITGAAVGSYANQIVISDNCHFVSNTSSHILNSGQAWLVRGCTFEALPTGAAGGYSETFGSYALTFQGCWFGDGNGGSCVQIVGTQGFTFTGNYCSYGSGNGISVTGNGVSGFNVAGNAFVGSAGSFGVNFNATSGHSNGTIEQYSVTGGTAIANNAPLNWLVSN